MPDQYQQPDINNILQQFFARPEEHMETFQEAGLDVYDPAKEQLARQQMQQGQDQAQQEAQGSMWKQFEAGRKGPVGGAFGNVNRAIDTSKTGVFKTLEEGREKAQLGFEEEKAGFQEDYMKDVYGLVGSIQAGGAQEATEFSKANSSGECNALNGRWSQNMSTGQYSCSPGRTDNIAPGAPEPPSEPTLGQQLWSYVSGG